MGRVSVLAAAKYHVLAGFIAYMVFVAAYSIYFSSFIYRSDLLNLLSDYKWVVLGLFLALFGATLSDYDLLYKYLSPWHHRSAITHSALVPTVTLLTYLFPTPLRNYAILIVCFMLGFASHLFLDYFPSVDIEKLLIKAKYEEAKKEIISSLLVGLTPIEELDEQGLKRLRGTYNIHFPAKLFKSGKRKTLSPKWTRAWLITNGAITLAYGILLFALFASAL